MHHSLLVAGLVIGEGAGGIQLKLEQRLAQAGDVAVPEDAEAPFEEAVLDTVAFAHLLCQEPDGRLGNSQSGRRHVSQLPFPDAVVSGSRGSAGCADHVDRTHECAGSSRASQTR